MEHSMLGRVGPFLVAMCAVVGAGVALQEVCGYNVDVLRPCVTGRPCSLEESAQFAHKLCPSVKEIKELSPRWLGKVVALGGPAIGWLPVILLGGWTTDLIQQRAITVSVAVYSAFIWILRNAELFSSFDPSGHVFILTLAIIPVGCYLLDSRSDWVGRLVGMAVVGLGLYVVLATSAFFHTKIEAVAGLVVAVGGVLGVEAMDAGMGKVGMESLLMLGWGVEGVLIFAILLLQRTGDLSVFLNRIFYDVMIVAVLLLFQFPPARKAFGFHTSKPREE